MKINHGLFIIISHISQLTQEQQTIINLVTNGHNVYVGGIGGCGNTFVCDHILQLQKTGNLHVHAQLALHAHCTKNFAHKQFMHLPELDNVEVQRKDC